MSVSKHLCGPRARLPTTNYVYRIAALVRGQKVGFSLLYHYSLPIMKGKNQLFKNCMKSPQQQTLY